jgi:hypothetical protein
MVMVSVYRGVRGLKLRGAQMQRFAVIAQVALSGSRMYDLLWGAVFGFATLNILGLVARRFEPGRSRMTFGEMLAIIAAAISVLMLGWELLFLFHVLPIRLDSR